MPAATSRTTWARGAWTRAVETSSAGAALERTGAERLSQSAARLTKAAEQLNQSNARIGRGEHRRQDHS